MPSGGSRRQWKADCWATLYQRIQLGYNPTVPKEPTVGGPSHGNDTNALVGHISARLFPSLPGRTTGTAIRFPGEEGHSVHVGLLVKLPGTTAGLAGVLHQARRG